MSVQYFSRVASPDKPKSRVIESKLHQSIVVFVGVGFIERRSTLLFAWLMDNSPNQRLKWCLYVYMMYVGFSYPIFFGAYGVLIIELLLLMTPKFSHHGG